MRSWVLALACVAACGGGQGVDVEVRGNGLTFDSVELYIAYDKCHHEDGTDCDGVAWPQAQDRAPGTVFVLKGDEKVVRTSDIAEGAATIHLEAAEGFDHPKALAVVAYQGMRVVGVQVLYDVAIPRGDQEKWQVELHAVATATTDIQTPPASDAPDHRVLAWLRESSHDLPDPTGYAGCLAYQQWTGSEWDTQYFVPATDTDCDGAPPDCDPLWSHRPAGTAKCVTRVTAPALANACVLGTQTCVDESSQQACTPSTTPLICMPSGVCTNCGDSDNLLTCLKDVVSTAINNGTTGSAPSMSCLFVPDPNATTVNGPCAQTVALGAERMTFKVPGMCSATTSNALLRPITTPFSGGSPTMVIGGTATMTVHATPGSGNCDVQIDWTQGEGKNPQVVVLALQYGLRHVLIPISIGFRQSTCPVSPGACMPIGDWPNEPNNTPGDSMFLCATAPPG